MFHVQEKSPSPLPSQRQGRCLQDRGSLVRIVLLYKILLAALNVQALSRLAHYTARQVVDATVGFLACSNRLHGSIVVSDSDVERIVLIVVFNIECGCIDIVQVGVINDP